MVIDDPALIPDAFAAALADAPPGPLGLAVSGGGDSMALLALALDWAGTARPLHVVTVDHGLRPEAAAEAAAVSDLCLRCALPHDTLHWTGWDGSGNLAEAAREGRRALLAGWARERGLSAILLGHTADDQAETFLMRLARGSGIGGLAAMGERGEAGGVTLLRPLLSIRREALRHLLRRRGWTWAEDPSNDDMRRDRIRARAMLGELDALGLSVARLWTTARHMADAREVLDAAEADLSRAALRWSVEGEARLLAEPWAEAPRATALQLLADALTAVAGAAHPPRLESLERVRAQVLAGEAGGTSLHGCMIRMGGDAVILRREPARAAGPVPAADGAVWDGRWHLRCRGAVPEGAEIRALGLGGLARIIRLPGGPAAETLRALPAIWVGEELLAAPLAGAEGDWRAEFVIPDPRRRRLLTGR